MLAENRVPVRDMFRRQKERQGDGYVKAFHGGKAPTYEGRPAQEASNTTETVISPAQLHRKGKEANPSSSDETDPSDDE